MKILLCTILTGSVVLIPAFGKSTSDTISGGFYTGKYQNLFTDLLDKSRSEVSARIDLAYQQLFFGDDREQRIYYPVEPDMGYILDVNNNDVRTEGMSYGMMIAVQLNRKEIFDRIWKWTKIHMQHREGKRKGYFAWHCKTSGAVLDAGSASDGEEWFVMALFFAAARWGEGEGIFAYRQEAQAILDAMLGKMPSSNSSRDVTNMFNREEKQIVFVPNGSADDFTDPSYHTPHFYELWALWADGENQFWKEAALASREFLKKTVHPRTGLAPDYARFDGTPVDAPWGGGQKDFRYDAWRVIMNVAVDYEWFGKDPWAVEQSNRLLDFFHDQGLEDYGSLFTLDGRMIGKDHSAGLVAMNAVAALASTNPNKKDFVEALWELPVPEGRYRYYDGILYMLGLLQVSGNFRIYPLETAE